MYCIYGLKADCIVYCGLTKNREKREYWHRKYQTIGTDKFEFVILFDNIPSRDEANEMEKVFIDKYDTYVNGFNKTRGGSRNTEFSDATRNKMSDSAIISNRQRLDNGTHPFLNSEIQRRITRRRVDNETHNFLGGEIQRDLQNRRVVDGTNSFLNKSPTILSHLSMSKYKLVFFYVVLIPKSYWEWLHDRLIYERRVRDGFFDIDIVDTSQSEQLKLC